MSIQVFLDSIKDTFYPQKKVNRILSIREKNFIQEYLKLNSMSISSSCDVKTDHVDKSGYLTLKNSKLSINQFQSNKTIELNTENNINAYVDYYYPIFFIDFNMVTAELIIHKKKQKFRLIILGKNYEKNNLEDKSNDHIYKYRIVKFRMPYESSEVFKLICEGINKSIILSNGYKYNIFSINLRNNFCNEYFVDYKEFEKRANTGDILLFKGYTKGNKFQRLVTDAEYDHVAALFRDKSELNVFESMGKDGVKLRPWDEFLVYYWYLLYDKMTWRKLNIDKEAMKKYVLKQIEEQKDNNDSIENDFDINDTKLLEQKFYFYFNKKFKKFIEKTENRKYNFSKRGFFCKSKMRKNYENRKGYSCSELIASLYYYNNIITNEYEASNYLPGNFSRKGITYFIEGFKLGAEFIIDFSSSFI